MGTPCNRMCLSSVTAGCMLGGRFLSSCGPLASTHTWKNPTVVALTASCFAELPRLGGRSGNEVGVFPFFFVILYLVIPLVVIPETFLKEVEGYAILCDCWGLHHGLASIDALTGGFLLVS